MSSRRAAARRTLCPTFILEQVDRAVGNLAAAIRSGMEIEGQRATNLERIWGQRFAGTLVKKVETSPLIDLDTPVSLSFTLRVPSFVDLGSREVELPPLRDLLDTTRSLRRSAIP